MDIKEANGTHLKYYKEFMTKKYISDTVRGESLASIAILRALI